METWSIRTWIVGPWRIIIETFPRKRYPYMAFLSNGSNKRFPSTLLPCSLLSVSAAAAKSLQSCRTLGDPIDGSPSGSPVPGILQGRTLEWVAISFSSAWKWKVKVKSLSRVWLFATSWTAAHQAPLSMGFSRQEYWSGMPLPSPAQCLWPSPTSFMQSGLCFVFKR